MWLMKTKYDLPCGLPLGMGSAKPSAHPPLPCLGWERPLLHAEGKGGPLGWRGGGVVSVVFGFLTSFPRAVGLSCKWDDGAALLTSCHGPSGQFLWN